VRLVILGSGTSFGVPVIGCECRVCKSTDPRNKRTRVAALMEGDDGAVILVDTPPEIRLQLVNANVRRVDAVLYTHDHADHIHGIDDLRAISVRIGELPVYGPPETLDRLEQRFGYIFDPGIIPPAGTTKPRLTRTPLDAGKEVVICGQTVLPLEVDHGGTRVYGYRFGRMAYVTDAKDVPATTRRMLDGVEILVVNALFERQHPTHLSIPEAVSLAGEVGARHTYLTHLTHDFAHTELASRLPSGVEPAYDGLSVVF
jgi:phosphoribosyl 1,2-cyclic phosphate phosphodiesterase